jgi:predicted DCC family thiol-disulfide oxidoreductase YuxK
MRTQPPGHHVILFDGLCRFCAAGSERLARWMRRGKVERADFHQPGVLERFPGLTHEACMKHLHLVAPDGRVFVAAESVARALTTLPVVGLLAWLYYVPGLRQLLEWLYALIARNRYRILGKRVQAGECEGGTCAIHFARKS